MKAVFIILSCLAVTALAQWNRPQLNQPSRRPATCSSCRDSRNPGSSDVPAWCPECPNDPIPNPPVQPAQCGANCSNGNRHFLWPHADPNMFWQCRGTVVGGFEPVEQLCACPTLFDFRLQRCVHHHEWTRQCNQQPNVAVPNVCPTCPDCGQYEPVTPPSLPMIPECPCVCNICISWPCPPCPSNCCRT